MAKHVVVSVVSSKTYLQSVYDRLIIDGYHPTWIPAPPNIRTHKRGEGDGTNLFYIARLVEKNDIILTAAKKGKADMSYHFAFVDA